MMSDYEVIDTIPIDENKLPSIISNQFEALERVKKNVGTATKKADSALSSAKAVADRDAGIMKRKKTIEAIQSVTVDLAEAQVAAAEAQEVSFEYQQSLTEMSKFLFGLGVSNIAANRCVVRELELRLKGASQEELDDLARKELSGVVQQLKAQEDIMNKQQELSKKVKGHDSRITGLEDQTEDNARKIDEQIAYAIEQGEHIKQNTEKGQELDRRLQRRETTDAAQDVELARLASKDIEHDKRIDVGVQKDKEQDDEIARQAQKDDEHDRRLNAGDEKDKVQDAEIARQAQKNEEHDRRLNAGDEKDKQQDDELNRRIAIDEQHNQQISQLFAEEENQLQLITVLQDKVSSLEEQCTSLKEIIASNDSKHEEKESNLDKKIENRFTKGASILSAVIGAAGLIAAIIGFFL